MLPNPYRNPQNGEGSLAPALDRATAAKIIESYQQRAPVDVTGIASSFGITVYAEDLGPNVSGILRRDPQLGGASGYVILAQKIHPLNRQRFTVAHELGHFVLHRSQVNERENVVEDEFYRAFPGPLETQANAFAADTLMPWSLINRFTEAGVTDLAELAKRLAVSKQALAIRLGLPYDDAGWS